MSGMNKATWEAISSLLDELLDADAEHREARLSQIRAQYPALAEQVSALLAQQPAINAERFLDESVVASLDRETIVGRSIGGYTLERALGHGGMGTVWLARRSDGRYEGHVAIKLLNLALLGYGGERLRREANALAKLGHPSITHLIDAGVSAGQPYLVLEYVEGEPIDQWCDEQRLDVEARVRLFLQVLGAVSHAHGRLVLHRDLKPSNILVTGFYRSRCAKYLRRAGKVMAVVGRTFQETHTVYEFVHNRIEILPAEPPDENGAKRRAAEKLALYVTTFWFDQEDGVYADANGLLLPFMDYYTSKTKEAAPVQRDPGTEAAQESAEVDGGSGSGSLPSLNWEAHACGLLVTRQKDIKKLKDLHVMLQRVGYTHTLQALYNMPHLMAAAEAAGVYTPNKKRGLARKGYRTTGGVEAYASEE